MLNVIKDVAKKMESYKKSDRKSIEYAYKDVTYKKSSIKGIAVFAFMNYFLALLFIVIYGEVVGRIFNNSFWWVPFVIIIVLLIVLPIIVFAVADKKDCRSRVTSAGFCLLQVVYFRKRSYHPQRWV